MEDEERLEFRNSLTKEKVLEPVHRNSETRDNSAGAGVQDDFH